MIVRASPHLNTLLSFRYKRDFKGPRGEHGKGSGKKGRSAEPLILEVPIGTLVVDEKTGAVLADLVDPGQQAIVAQGGRGGRGNERFKSATNRAPRTAEPGQLGCVRTLVLELKLLADVGLVGLPNAGKSTLISRLSDAKPKIASYPFTTLSPNLGVLHLSEYRTAVLADIPGIIEGAHSGAGLGLEFLRHIERTKIIVHLVDLLPAEGRQPLSDYQVVRRELSHYSPIMAAKPEIVALTKLDVVGSEERLSRIQKEFEAIGLQPLAISAVSGSGLRELVRRIAQQLEACS